MESMRLKKAIITSSEIVILRKKENIIIKFEDIEMIEYQKPTLINFLLSSVWFGGIYPGRMEIYLRKKINNTKLYLVRIKYTDVQKLPKPYLRMIYPTENFD